MKTTRCLSLILVVLLLAVTASAEDVNSKLQQLGETYSRAYIQPLITALGINQNSGLYHTAGIPGTGRISINVGLKVMTTAIDDADKVFMLTDRVDAHLLNPAIPSGTMVPVVIAGPTVFGSKDTQGTITPDLSGLSSGVASQLTGLNGVSGLTDTSLFPSFTPEISVAGLMGLRATVRWLPDMDLGDYGKIKYKGYGLQYGINELVPTLPLDVMAGFFKQDLDLGDALETSAFSTFVAASKAFTVATVYGGLALETSSVDVTYTFSGQTVTYEMDGEQDVRATIGGTLNLGMKLNAEMSVGDSTNYTFGVLYGF
jgi:Family of unknown function (DUF6588)